MSIQQFFTDKTSGILQLITSVLARIRLAWHGVEVASGVKFMGVPIVQRFQDSRISIEAGVTLCSSSYWTALGVTHPVVLHTLKDGAHLHIGAGTRISGGSFCAAVSIDIGKNCLIGADVMICDTDFHTIDPLKRSSSDVAEVACKPVSIGDNVFIGARSIILKGVTIGENSVIGAGSVVTRNIPANAIAAGNPAQLVRELNLLKEAR